LTVSNTDTGAKPTQGLATRSRFRGFAKEEGKFRIRERGEHLMKTPNKSKRRSRALLLSLLCAGVVATFLGGCAEGPYVTAYHTGYYPTAYYTPSSYNYGYPYSYYNGYGRTYDRTVVRSGVRYYDSYGPHYYSSYYGRDWYCFAARG
jgi:hypothetical protein